MNNHARPDPHPSPRLDLPHIRPWQHDDFDVFGGDRDVGRIYGVDRDGDRESFFWGVSFQLTGRKNYGRADSLDEAKAAFKMEYAAWASGASKAE